MGDFLDGDAEHGVLGVAEDLCLEVGHRRLDGLCDQRLTDGVPFAKPLLVFVAHDVLAVFPGQALDFDQIGFNAVDVFLDILGAGTRNNRDRQLFDVDMHEVVDVGELADRHKAVLVQLGKIVVQQTDAADGDHRYDRHGDSDQGENSPHLRLDTETFHDWDPVPSHLFDSHLPTKTPVRPLSAAIRWKDLSTSSSESPRGTKARRYNRP